MSGLLYCIGFSFNNIKHITESYCELSIPFFAKLLKPLMQHMILALKNTRRRSLLVRKYKFLKIPNIPNPKIWEVLLCYKRRLFLFLIPCFQHKKLKLLNFQGSWLSRCSLYNKRWSTTNQPRLVCVHFKKYSCRVSPYILD